VILPGTGRGTVRAANGGGGATLRKPVVYLARKLRRQLSPPEVLLWDRLRASKLGFRVRRQHPIGNYVADFYIPSARLVLEVDGNAHDFGDRPTRDHARDQSLVSAGYRVVRVPATEVIRDLDEILRSIVAEVGRPLHHPADGPPPRIGEDQR